MPRPTLINLEEMAELATVEVAPSRIGPARAFTMLIAVSAAVGVALSAIAAPSLVAASSGVDTAADFWDQLPDDLPYEVALPQHTVLLDKDGIEFARFTSENRIDVTAEQISPNFTEALIATEDVRFYEHGGVDLQGVVRAFVKNATSDGKQGASTITQQLVQNILISNARNDVERDVAVGDDYGSKLREIKYAVALEKKLTKSEILTAYSNAVFLGNRAYGVQAAARVYFNTDAASLTVPQAAVLVAMLKSPIQYDPYQHPEASKNRRDTVIGQMLAAGYLTQAEADDATAAPTELITGVIPSGCSESAYPYYCALVRDEILVDEAFGATAEQRQETLRRGGMILTTALDRKVMDASAAATVRALGTDNRVAAGTAVVVPGTGHIAAVAQNRTWDQTEVIYATRSFQPGSVMKPFVLATALEQGYPLSTSFNSNGPYFSKTLDEPTRGFNNFGNARAGTIDARTAIRQSVNIYFIKLIEKTGVIPVADMARRLGITTLPDLNGSEASLALGTYDMSPLEVANAYSVFIAGGIKCRPISITSGVRADTGAPITTPDPDCHQEIDPNVADTMSSVLTGTFERGGTLASVGALPDRTAGAKTGTTDNSAANWTAGITPQYATAVWVGDPRGGQQYPLKNIRAYGRGIGTAVGASVAGPVWKDVMLGAHAGLPAIQFPTPNEAALPQTTARTVPDVRGLTLDAAYSALVDAGLTPTIDQATAADDAITRPGTVTGQIPAAGSGRGADTTITLTLSHGSDTNVQPPSK